MRDKMINIESQSRKDYYMDGEEKFGYFTSRIYNMTKLSGTIREFYRFITDDIRKIRPERILDIGSGTGTILMTVLKENPEISGIGIDPSRHMVHKANLKSKRKGLSGRLRFVQGSSRQIEVSQKFPLIISSLSFHHWKERNESLVNIMKYLDESGKFIVYEMYDDGSLNRKLVKSHLMSSDDFKRISEATGFPVDISVQKGILRAVYSR